MFDHFVGLVLKGLRTLSNICDRAFLQKQLTAFSRSLFSQESSTIDVRMDPKYAFGSILQISEITPFFTEVIDQHIPGNSDYFSL